MLAPAMRSRTVSATTGRAIGVALAVAALLVPTRAAAEPAEADPVPPNYLGLFAGTSLVYRPPGGPADGVPGDLNLSIGYGRSLTASLAVELDLGPTFVDGDYVGFSLVPSAIYVLTPYAYTALRVIVPVDPEWNLALAPGVGLMRPLGPILGILELSGVSFVGRGDPDLAVSLTAGALYFF